MLAELRPLWRIAWPLLIAQTAQIGTGVVDTLMAGNYRRRRSGRNRGGFQYLAATLPDHTGHAVRLLRRSWRKTSARGA
jgi:hypothetical protein